MDDVVERLYPAWWLWIVTVVLGASCGVVVARFDGTAAVVTFVVATVVLAGLLLASTPTVGVRDGEFVAGRARIPVGLLGDVEVLDAPALRHAVGPGLDARSYLCLRGWVGTGLRLAITDPQDPTPSWIVSSRDPGRLARAVEARRDRRVA